MRAVRCQGNAIRVVEVPRPVGDGVRVRVKAAGICGSDLHLLGRIQGVTLGHEIAGVTDDGTAVAVEPLSPCRRCAPCQRGDYNLCVRGAAIVHGIAKDGGMADELRVPEAALAPLPTGVKTRDASLVEPLSVALHGLRRASLCAGERVLIIGGGAIGLCALAAAKDAGAQVALLARHDAQREAALRLGAHLAEAEGEYDLVIEAAGSESALAEAVRRAKPGARICVVGSYWQPVTLPGMALCMKEVNLIPASMYGRAAGVRDIERAVALLAAQPEIARTLITHRFPLDAAAEAFAVAAERDAGAIKVVLEP